MVERPNVGREGAGMAENLFFGRLVALDRVHKLARSELDRALGGVIAVCRNPVLHHAHDVGLGFVR